jgi:deoxycytidine triphosphate deaminase
MGDIKKDDPQHPHEWKSRDPDANQPDRKGMLLSDQIHKFASDPVNLLIAENYSPKMLRPAAYTLTIGDDYVDHRGRRRKLSEKQPSFEMEPNSIVFVSIREKLDLPYYIAARFNLRVDWVYKGILLGTGPQVEPGFRGFLSCPLYNLTNRSVLITRKDEFATIDFERTTKFVDKTPAEIAAKTSRDKKLDLYEEDGRRFLLFKQELMMPLEKYPKDYKIISSLDELSREVKTWRAIGIGIAVSFLALSITLLGLHNTLLRDSLGNAKDLIQLKQDVSTLQERVHSLQEQLAATEKQKDRGANEGQRVQPAAKPH